jgi:hypothetical protein
MMCQNYLSVAVPYRTTAEMGGGVYYPDIPAPYGERLAASSSGATGLWVDGERVLMSGITDQHAWPSWGISRWEWNAVTGEFIERGTFVGSLYAEDVNQGAGGELYLTYVTGPVYPLGPAPTYELLDPPILPARFGYISLAAPFFDQLRDRAVIGGQSGARVLRVFVFSTGVWIRDIAVPAAVLSIVHDDAARIFVLLGNKSILSIDYETGQVFSYVRLPQITNTIYARIAWNKTYRRLLVVEVTPDNVDGTSTTVVRGYRYIDVPVYVCKPIALSRLRNGVKSLLLVKQVGDLGAGIGGLATVSSLGASGVVTRASVGLDGDGEGHGEILGTAEGNETVTVTAEAACLL